MRSISLPKPVLLAALGCMVLSGCGTQNATTDQTPAGAAVSATTPPDAPPGDNDPEMRFLALLTRITHVCAPDAPNGSGTGDAPKPEDLPGWEGAPTPAYGPGETPPGVPNAEGEIPVPLDDPAASEPAPDFTWPRPVKEVPLTGIEKCTGDEHAKRVSEAFQNTKTTSYQAVQSKLTDLDYPASRIHRMPDHAGAPRTRLDLRMMGSHLALEVTGTGSGVTVEAFGSPETEDVKVTEVNRKPKLDAPTS
ncbi:hypothetical protein [Streptomyces flavidovirens]|uniref:hypothetical protein n=1 Tax=Streptomyces flavidovirens TaxID=67298 RepID=UPI000490F53D|nr:hypothetical protein [Streptomyces flavidovirens]